MNSRTAAKGGFPGRWVGSPLDATRSYVLDQARLRPLTLAPIHGLFCLTIEREHRELAAVGPVQNLPTLELETVSTSLKNLPNICMNVLKIVPIEHDPVQARDYLNDRSLQIGHILPVGDGLLREHFASGSGFLVLKGKAIDAMFSYHTGRDKHVPTARFRVVTDSLLGLKEATRVVEETAVAGEKLVVTTTVFGYDRKRLVALKALGYTVGASLPGTVALDGRRFDYHILFKDLGTAYKSKRRRSYAKPGLYKPIEVEKAKTPKFKIRGYKREDRPLLDKFIIHQNVIRGIASGVFEDLYPWPLGGYQQRVDFGHVFPIVCEDESTREPVGTVDLSRDSVGVMQHSMSLGIVVRAEYQGLGVGTMLMEAARTLAMRLHLARIWLGVFEGNTPAQRLYQKAGFEESGRVPGWLQEGYVDEIFMTLKLD